MFCEDFYPEDVSGNCPAQISRALCGSNLQGNKVGINELIFADGE